MEVSMLVRDRFEELLAQAPHPDADGLQVQLPGRPFGSMSGSGSSSRHWSRVILGRGRPGAPRWRLMLSIWADRGPALKVSGPSSSTVKPTASMPVPPSRIGAAIGTTSA